MKNETFIEAAIALGVPQWRIVLHHVLPNVASPIIVRTSMAWASRSSLPPRSASSVSARRRRRGMGRMISESREFLPDWWYALAPGVAILPS